VRQREKGGGEAAICGMSTTTVLVFAHRSSDAERLVAHMIRTGIENLIDLFETWS
jgi:hypothetical protein